MALLDSTRLNEFYAELTQELRFYLMVLSVEDREFENPDVILAEHEAILSALRTGDPDDAVREVRAHIETNAQRLKQMSRNVVQVTQGTLYPALHRLENRGFLAADWKPSDTGRDAKFYRLTRTGQAQLENETANWHRLTEAVGFILREET